MQAFANVSEVLILCELNGKILVSQFFLAFGNLVMVFSIIPRTSVEQNLTKLSELFTIARIWNVACEYVIVKTKCRQLNKMKQTLERPHKLKQNYSTLTLLQYTY